MPLGERPSHEQRVDPPHRRRIDLPSRLPHHRLRLPRRSRHRSNQAHGLKTGVHFSTVVRCWRGRVRHRGQPVALWRFGRGSRAFSPGRNRRARRAAGEAEEDLAKQPHAAVTGPEAGRWRQGEQAAPVAAARCRPRSRHGGRRSSSSTMTPTCPRPPPPATGKSARRWCSARSPTASARTGAPRSTPAAALSPPPPPPRPNRPALHRPDPRRNLRANLPSLSGQDGEQIPQHPPARPDGNLDPAKMRKLGMVRRFRPLHPRPNAIALGNSDQGVVGGARSG